MDAAGLVVVRSLANPSPTCSVAKVLTGMVSLQQAQYDLAEGETLTNTMLSYDTASDTLNAVTVDGPNGCTPAVAG